MSGEIERVEDAARTLREYAGSDVSQAWVRLIDALAASSKEDLVNAELGAVTGIQAQIKQLYALREVVTSKLKTNGRV